MLGELVLEDQRGPGDWQAFDDPLNESGVAADIAVKREGRLLNPF